MKISTRLIVSFCLVALVSSVPLYFNLKAFSSIDSGFERLMNDPVPMIKSLEDLKNAGIRIVSSTIEYCFIVDESEKADQAGALVGEEELIAEGQEKFELSLKIFEGTLSKQPNPEELEFLNTIKRSGRELIQTSAEIVEMKKSRARGEVVLEKKEEFEEIEKSYLLAVDAALTHKYGEFDVEQNHVQSTIADATGAVFIVGGMVFLLALFLGLYVARSIAKPILSLKKASERVGRGELDTLIEIKANDEVGDLSRSFNKMVGDLKSSQIDLAAEKLFIENVLNSMIDFVVVTDMELRITRINQATLSLNGYEESELLGKSVNVLMGDRPFNQKGIDILRKNGFLANIDKLNLNKDGSLTPISMSLSVLKDDSGNEVGIVCVGKDITERKAAQEELLRLNTESEAQKIQLKDILANAPCVISEMPVDSSDENAGPGFVSEYVTEVFGYTPEEWLSIPDLWESALHPEDREEMSRRHEELFLNGSASIRARWITKDGRTIWCDTQLELVKDVSGKPLRVRGVTTDITRRIRAEAERQVISEIIDGVTSTANLDELLRLIHGSISKLVDAGNCFVALHDRETDMLDMQFWVDKYDPLPPPFKMGRGFTAYVCRTEQPILMTTSIIERLLKDGELHLQGTSPAIWLGVPLRTSTGMIGVLALQHYDDPNAYNESDLELLVSVGDQIALAIERKRVAEALAISEEQHRLLFESNPQPSFVYDLETLEFLTANEAAIQYYGYSKKDLLSKITIRDIHPPEVHKRFRKRASEVSPDSDKILVPSRHLKKDGTISDVEVTSHSLIFNGRQADIVLVSDITERKTAEHESARLTAEIESQRRRLNNIVAHVQGIVWETKTSVGGVDNRLDFISNHAETMTGYPRDEWLAKPQFWLDIVHPEDRRMARRAAFDIFKSGGNGNVEFRWVAKDGRVFWVESRNLGITDDKGNMIGLRGVIVDISERKDAEERLKVFNEKLQQSNRELQDFAYVASHDMQEPLRKVQAFSDRLRTKYSDKLGDEGLDYLERMRSAANRMQLLIEDLLTFSRVSTKARPFVPVDLKSVTREVLGDLEVKIEETGAEIEIDDLPTIDADPMQIRQLMQNLIGNALKFNKPDTAPRIEIRTSSLTANGNGRGKQCQISVQDHGIGFDEKYKDKIFAVFQRLHGRNEYEGSGVGLAICRKIVERHNGDISVHSKPGEGSTFVVTLPIRQPASAEQTNKETEK